VSDEREGPQAVLADRAHIATSPAARFTVWGCPLLTAVALDHPFLGGFAFRVDPRLLAVGASTTASCGGTIYTVQRVR